MPWCGGERRWRGLKPIVTFYVYNINWLQFLRGQEKRVFRTLQVAGIGNHTFRATGVTACLQNGGTLENAAAMANHALTRTTQLYDRRREGIIP